MNPVINEDENVLIEFQIASLSQQLAANHETPNIFTTSMLMQIERDKESEINSNEAENSMLSNRRESFDGEEIEDGLEHREIVAIQALNSNPRQNAR
jgi:hypothetical protein